MGPRTLQAQLEKLQQINQLLQDIDAMTEAGQKLADDLFTRAEGIMIASAPTALHVFWHKINMRHLAILSESIRQLSSSSELMPNEEELYRKALEDQSSPYS